MYAQQQPGFRQGYGNAYGEEMMTSPAFSEQTAMIQGLGNEQMKTDDHTFYVFQSQLELEKKIEKAKI